MKSSRQPPTSKTLAGRAATMGVHALLAGALGCGQPDRAPVLARPVAPPPSPPAAASSAAPPAPAASAAPSAAPAEPPAEAAAPLPDGFVRVAEDGSTTCGALRIEVHQESPKAWRRFVRVFRDGRSIYEAHGRKFPLDGGDVLEADLYAEFCGDLTGDGVPEIVMTESTMGAHCCYTRYVVSMTAPPKRLLMWEKGDAGTAFLPVKYRAGAAWQLEDLLVVWPPFNPEKGDPALSYASAPLVPVVFSLVGGDYKMTSLSFPEAYRKQRDEVRAGCKKEPDQCNAIALWIDSLALGDWPAVKREVDDADLRSALDRRANAMKTMLARFGSTARPIDPSPRPH